MAKSVMPKQTSGWSDSSEWDGSWNGEPQRLGPYRTSYRIVIGACRAWINMASAGSGSTSHVTGELFKMMAGVEIVRHIAVRRPH